MTPQTSADHPYVGMWVTDDGLIRHRLLPDGRYDEARGARESAYRGRYWVTGDHIDYVDDTGFTADGNFVDDVLHHAGMILRRLGDETVARRIDRETASQASPERARLEGGVK